MRLKMVKAVSSEVPLGSAGAALWDKITGAYDVSDQHGQVVLLSACRAADRAEECRLAIEKDGLTTTDRWGQVKAHPLVHAEREARSQVLAALKALSLPIPTDKPTRRL